MTAVIEPATTEQARAILGSDGLPVLVDFSASWCGPCQALAPVLDAYASAQAGKVRVLKIDIDVHQELAAQAGIRSVPTLLVVKNGEVLAAKAGALGLRQLEAFVQGALG